MKQRNTTLALVALGLLVASVFAYRYSEGRGDRFERGRKLLANLNPEEVAAIRIQEGDESLNLERRGKSFRIAERDGYTAKNESVNRLLKALLDISLEKKIGTGDKLAETLELEPPGSSTVDVTLEDANGKAMVQLRLGKEFEGGGVYAQRRDGSDDTIYLTTSRPFLDTAPEDFLKKEIVDVTASQITRIEGRDFEVQEFFEEPPAPPADETAAGEVEGEAVAVADADGDATIPIPPAPVSLGLQLADLPDGKSENATAMNKVKGALTRLEFEEVYPADSPQVAGLAFDRRLSVTLKDTTGYILSLAEKDDKHYLRIEGFSTVDRVEIAPDESEEELKEKADSLTRADEIQDFNAFHGTWVYEIAERFAEKLKLTKRDLVE